MKKIYPSVKIKKIIHYCWTDRRSDSKEPQRTQDDSFWQIDVITVICNLSKKLDDG